MSNPMLREDKFGLSAGQGRTSGGTVPSPSPSYGARGTLGGPGTGHGGPVAPAPDTVSPWPPTTGPVVGADTLRRGGVASATAVLLAIICVTGVVGWNAVTTTTVDEGLATESTSISIPPWIIGAVIVGFILALVSFFVPRIAPITAPLYAVAEGVFIGAISKAYEVQFDGIVIQAVGLTVGVFLMMLVLYATGRIRVTPRFRLGVMAATGGVLLVYLVTFVAGFFTDSLLFIHDNGVVGIGFSLLVVGIAALNLTLDFDFIDRAEQAGAPRHMEWFAALGLVVTLVWLYLELLRLLAKLRSR